MAKSVAKILGISNSLIIMTSQQKLNRQVNHQRTAIIRLSDGVQLLYGIMHFKYNLNALDSKKTAWESNRLNCTCFTSSKEVAINRVASNV